MNKLITILTNYAVIATLISALNIVTSKTFVQDEIVVNPSYQKKDFEVVIKRVDPNGPPAEKVSNIDLALKIIQAFVVTGGSAFPQEIIELRPSYNGVKLSISVSRVH